MQNKIPSSVQKLSIQLLAVLTKLNMYSVYDKEMSILGDTYGLDSNFSGKLSEEGKNVPILHVSVDLTDTKICMITPTTNKNSNIH